MARTVRLLDETLVDQIAAGEVIERPANLVKELIENALDAHASSITVSVEDGGRGQVRVTDDGVGMSAEDARLSIERHATSKIASFEDMLSVTTLGFRGEALPSIGSVSRMTITTRPKTELEGTRVVVEGGELREVSAVGCPPGTSVEVADLFYNVPARKKFLRARQTETSRVFEICQRLALSHPELRLAVSSDGRSARRYLPTRSLAERAYQVFGDLQLLEIHAERDGVVLDAALAPAELSRLGARHLFLLVNGRPIADRAVARSIAFAYGNRLSPGHYPRGVVSIRVAPEDVDVNAHPQKNEVRFRRPSQLLDLVTRMIAPRLPSREAGDAYWDARVGGRMPDAVATVARPPDTTDARPMMAEASVQYAAQPADGLRLIGQVRNRLILCESPDELLVIDRERADAIERRDRLRKAAREGGVPPQHLLFPDRTHLSEALEDELARHDPLLRSMGFDWSALGPGAYVVRAVPAAVAEGRAAALLHAALEVLRETQPQTNAEETLFATLAAAAATPNGQPMADERARRIAAGIRPTEEAHGPCIVARVACPPADADARDD